MLKFGKILADSHYHNENFDIKEIYPKAVFRKYLAHSKLSKWAAYIDKYFIFTKRLKRNLEINSESTSLFHIIDQSNALYLKTIKKISSGKCLVTCHDLIAIRSAMGEFTSAPKSSLLGKNLQKCIQHSLSYADYYACDSESTKKDLNRITPSSKDRSKVIHLGTQFNLRNPKNCNIPKQRLPFEVSSFRFILHVGSAAWYKNRKSVFKAFKHLNQQLETLNLKLVLVGPPPQQHEIDSSIKKWIVENSHNILSVTNATEQNLLELYRKTELLIFPSFIEGFGWPPLEAASLGCPVITTNCGAIGEILGNRVTYVNPYDQKNINDSLFKILQKDKNLYKIKSSFHIFLLVELFRLLPRNS